MTEQLHSQLSAAAEAVTGALRLVSHLRDTRSSPWYISALTRALFDPVVSRTVLRSAVESAADTCSGLLFPARKGDKAIARVLSQRSQACKALGGAAVAAPQPLVELVRAGRDALVCGDEGAFADAIQALDPETAGSGDASPPSERERAAADVAFTLCLGRRAVACASGGAKGCSADAITRACASADRPRGAGAGKRVASHLAALTAGHERRALLTRLVHDMAQSSETEGDASDLDTVLAVRRVVDGSPTFAAAVMAWDAERRPIAAFGDALLRVGSAALDELRGEGGALALWPLAGEAGGPTAATIELHHWVAAAVALSAGAPRTDPAAVFRALYCAERPVTASAGPGAAESVYAVLSPDTCSTAVRAMRLDPASPGFASAMESLRLDAAARAFRLDRLIRRIALLRRLPGALPSALDAVGRELLGGATRPLSAGSDPAWRHMEALRQRAAGGDGNALTRGSASVMSDQSLANPLRKQQSSPRGAASYDAAARADVASPGSRRLLALRHRRRARSSKAQSPPGSDSWPLEREERLLSGEAEGAGSAPPPTSAPDPAEVPAALPGTGSLPTRASASAASAGPGSGRDEDAAQLHNSLWTAKAMEAVAAMEEDAAASGPDQRATNRLAGRHVSFAAALAAFIRTGATRAVEVKEHGFCACDKSVRSPGAPGLVQGRVERMVMCFDEPDAPDCVLHFAASTVQSLVRLTRVGGACSSASGGSATACAKDLAVNVRAPFEALYTKIKARPPPPSLCLCVESQPWLTPTAPRSSCRLRRFLSTPPRSSGRCPCGGARGPAPSI